MSSSFVASHNDLIRSDPAARMFDEELAAYTRGNFAQAVVTWVVRGGVATRDGGAVSGLSSLSSSAACMVVAKVPSREGEVMVLSTSLLTRNRTFDDGAEAVEDEGDL